MAMEETREDLTFISWVTRSINLTIMYGATFVLVIGVISNVLNILVCARKKMLQSTIGYYYIFISIFNIIAVVTGWLYIYPQAAGLGNLSLISGNKKICYIFYSIP
jgi:hypothetical protein